VRSDARSPSPFSDLFEIHSGIYLPTGYDVDLLSAEYSRTLCASGDFLVRLLAALLSIAVKRMVIVGELSILDWLCLIIATIVFVRYLSCPD